MRYIKLIKNLTLLIATHSHAGVGTSPFLAKAEIQRQ